jgi:hypothetical protein
VVLELQPTANESESRNIRRRVYDAINVLEGAGVLVKIKKQIYLTETGRKWTQVRLLRETPLLVKKQEALKRVEQKEEYLKALREGKTGLDLTLQRNKLLSEPDPGTALYAPFTLLATGRGQRVDLSMHEDRRTCLFELSPSSSVQIHNELSVMCEMTRTSLLGSGHSEAGTSSGIDSLALDSLNEWSP